MGYKLKKSQMIYDTYPRERIIVNKYLHSSLSNTFYLSVCIPLHDRIFFFLWSHGLRLKKQNDSLIIGGHSLALKSAPAETSSNSSDSCMMWSLMNPQCAWRSAEVV